MRRAQKDTQGVTLLEIMLVLAIAAMVIVMSIRYYGQATNSQNANVILAQLTNITQSGENLAQGPGTYASVTTATVTTVAGSKNMVTPYGSSITVTAGAQTSYVVTVPTIPAAVCASIAAKLKANTKMASTVACSGTTGNVNLTYTYDATK
jgi:Tfp pilus assembly protein PilE